LEFLLAQFIERITIILGQMKAVDNDIAIEIIVFIDKFVSGVEVAIPNVGGERIDRTS
jgi:hypothetical protein